MIKLQCQSCGEAYPPWSEHACAKPAKPVRKRNQRNQRNQVTRHTEAPVTSVTMVTHEGDRIADLEARVAKLEALLGSTSSTPSRAGKARDRAEYMKAYRARRQGA